MARDLAIDLGTANTLVYMKGRGIVLNEPSVIALNRQTGEVLATGREAWQMIGRTPGYIVAVRPLRGGAITDFEITERMIRLLLQRVGVSRFTRPKVVICVPSAITEVERRAVTDAARRAGAADANLIEQPMAAAIGADLPIDEPVGNMVIDIGGGTSETAVISLGGIVALEAVRVGSFDIDAAIQNYVRREHGIAIGERTAEEIKVAIGSADPTPDENQAEVRGRDLMSGLPKTVLLTPEEVRFAIEDVISSIVASVIRCLSKAPPELSQDFLVRGMYLVGGGGLLRGLAERIERETEVPVRMSNVPARGRRARRRSRDRALRGAEGHVHGGAPLTVQRLAGRPVAPSSAPGSSASALDFEVPGEFPADVLAEADRAGVGGARRSVRDGRRRPTGRSHRRRVRHARPGRRAPISTRRSRSRSTATTSCCRTPSPTWRASSNRAARSTPEAWRRGVTDLPARRPGQPAPAAAGRGCGEPAARRRASGDRVPRPGRPGRSVAARRRRAIGHPQPGQAGLLDRDARRPARRLRRAGAAASSGPRSSAAPSASRRPSRRWSGRDDGFELRFRPRSEIERAERGAVVGDEPGGGRRAATRRGPDCSARWQRRRRGAARAGCATRRGRSGSTGRGRSRWPTSCARCPADDPRTGAFQLAVRRAGGSGPVRAVPRGRRAVARGGRRDVLPRHGTAAPAGRSLRDRGRRSRWRPERPVPDWIAAAFDQLPAVMRPRRRAGEPGRSGGARRRRGDRARRAARARCSTPSSPTRTSAASGSRSAIQRSWRGSRPTASTPATRSGCV